MESGAPFLADSLAAICMNAVEVCFLYIGWASRDKLPVLLKRFLPKRPLPVVLACLPFLIGGYVLFYYNINNFAAALDGILAVSILCVGLLTSFGIIKS